MSAERLPIVVDVSPLTPAFAAPDPAASCPRDARRRARFRAGARVVVRFRDGLGIEAPHELRAEVVGRGQAPGRLTVRIGRTLFEVAEAACRCAGEATP